MGPRCLDCSADISDMHANCKRCVTCRMRHDQARDRGRYKNDSKRRADTKARAAAWSKANGIKIRKRNEERTPERRARQKESWYRKRYGVSHIVVESARVSRANLCDICKQPNAKLHVDHDHSSLRIRGMLCGNCNRGLGLFLDNPDLLRRAAGYLEAPCGL